MTEPVTDGVGVRPELISLDTVAHHRVLEQIAVKGGHCEACGATDFAVGDALYLGFLFLTRCRRVHGALTCRNPDCTKPRTAIRLRDTDFLTYAASEAGASGETPPTSLTVRRSRKPGRAMVECAIRRQLREAGRTAIGTAARRRRRVGRQRNRSRAEMSRERGTPPDAQVIDLFVVDVVALSELLSASICSLRNATSSSIHTASRQAMPRSFALPAPDDASTLPGTPVSARDRSTVM